MRMLLIFILLLVLLAESPAYAETPFFKKPNKLCTMMEKHGFKTRKPWKYSEWSDYSCMTDYIEIGSYVNNIMPNNIAYYIDGKESDEAQNIKLVLNINQPNSSTNAKEKLLDASVKLFAELKEPMPKGLEEAILNKENFEEKTSHGTIKHEVHKSKIYTLKVIYQND